jgi:beta-lysine 5,6-aminomutase alpha subunit
MTYLVNGMYNLVSVLTGQEIQLLGMLTEAIHTPFISDRYLSIANSSYIFNNARNLGKKLIMHPEEKSRKGQPTCLMKPVKCCRRSKK